MHQHIIIKMSQLFGLKFHVVQPKCYQVAQLMGNSPLEMCIEFGITNKNKIHKYKFCDSNKPKDKVGVSNPNDHGDVDGFGCLSLNNKLLNMIHFSHSIGQAR
jgi:hypothetical protein